MSRRSGDERFGNTADAMDADKLLAEIGFVEEESVLTRRQAEVLALRERGHSQADIADRLGTSRANVSSVESSARDNVAKAYETVALAEALHAPVRIGIAGGTDLYDVPDRVYEACDDAGLKVGLSAPELMKQVSDAGGDAVSGRRVKHGLVVTVAADGKLRVRRSEVE